MTWAFKLDFIFKKMIVEYLMQFYIDSQCTHRIEKEEKNDISLILLDVIFKIIIFLLHTSNGMLNFLGTSYTQQSYKVSESFPYKWINKKWKEGFHVTSMTTAGSRWGVVMSRNSGYSDQV